MRVARLGEPQVVEAKIGGQLRLVVTGETRPGAGDIAPLGEARSPEGVIFRHGMELRQEHRDRAEARRRGGCGVEHGAQGGAGMVNGVLRGPGETAIAFHSGTNPDLYYATATCAPGVRLH